MIRREENRGIIRQTDPGDEPHDTSAQETRNSDALLVLNLEHTKRREETRAKF